MDAMHSWGLPCKLLLCMYMGATGRRIMSEKAYCCVKIIVEESLFTCISEFIVS